MSTTAPHWGNVCNVCATFAPARHHRRADGAQWARSHIATDMPQRPALQVLAQGRTAEGRKLAPGSRLATLAELESVPA